jgi:glycosyltransferase involved in cell wall biosynthesis
MHVTALIAAEDVSGPARQLIAAVRPLEDEGIKMHVRITARRESPPPLAAYLDTADIHYSVVPDRGPLDWGMLGEVRAHIAAHGSAVLQTHGYKASAIGYGLRWLRAAPPWVAFYHGATRQDRKDTVYQWIERRLLRAADRVVVVSRAQTSLFNGLGHVDVIPNAVISMPDAVGDGGDAVPAAGVPVIGVVGRLSHEKGVDVFLHACRILADREIRFLAVIVGDGPERPALERVSRALRLDDHVQFAGRVEVTASLYRRLDVVVLPSRSEGLPNVLLEALAADRPVVATAVGAVPEVLQEPGSGILVAPGDASALAAGLERSIVQPLDAHLSAARTRVVARYSLAVRASRLATLYRGCPRPQPAAANAPG